MPGAWRYFPTGLVASHEQGTTAPIRKLYTSHNSRTGQTDRGDIAATHDEAVIAGYSATVLAWAGLLKQLLVAI